MILSICKGQVLWLKLPFGKTDDISTVYHPYLIIDVVPGAVKIVEVGQIDSVKDKLWLLTKEANKMIRVDEPKETVLYQLSYMQMDKKIQIEYFEELKYFQDNTDTLSSKKLDDIVNAYFSYHNKHAIEETKSMYFTKEDIEELNPIEEWKKAQQDRLTLNDRLPN